MLKDIMDSLSGAHFGAPQRNPDVDEMAVKAKGLSEAGWQFRFVEHGGGHWRAEYLSPTGNMVNAGPSKHTKQQLFVAATRAAYNLLGIKTS